MKRTLIVSLVLYLLTVSCGNLPDAPPLFDEETVLRVWDVLDEHYGREAFFVCEIQAVHNGQIRIAKPCDISRIAVVGDSSADDAPILFRVVPLDPGQNEFAAKGTTLTFHQSYEGQRLFVAWVPEPSQALSPQLPRGVGR